MPDAVAGSSYLTNLTATGGTGQRTWTAAQPYWLNIDPLTGDLFGTPPVAGPVSTTVQVADRYGITASKTFSFTVSPPSSGGLPALVSPCPLPGATVGVNYSQTLVAAGGSAPYQFLVFGLPAGLTASSGAIGGTPPS
ncbi:MAG: putative Ig domain-containing protein [Ignavibacteriota bacterium]